MSGKFETISEEYSQSINHSIDRMSCICIIVDTKVRDQTKENYIWLISLFGNIKKKKKMPKSRSVSESAKQDLRELEGMLKQLDIMMDKSVKWSRV